MSYGASGIVGAAAVPDHPDVEQRLPGILHAMNSRDFRERIAGIKDLSQLVASRKSVSEESMVRVLDAITARTQDGNTKVVAEALDALAAMFPAVGDSVAPGLNLLVPSLAAHMGSTNERVRQGAGKALDSLLRSVDQSLLVQHLSHCVSHSTGRGKAAMILVLKDVAVNVFPRRSQLVTKVTRPRVGGDRPAPADA